MKRVYLDHIAATPLDPGAAEAMRPFLDGRFREPAEPAQRRPGGARGRRGGPGPGGRARRRGRKRDHLHRLRVRGEQLRHQGAGARPPRQRLSPGPVGGRAPVGPPFGQEPGEVRVLLDPGAGGQGRPGRPRGDQEGDPQRDRPRLRHAGQQRGGHDRAGGRNQPRLPGRGRDPAHRCRRGRGQHPRRCRRARRGRPQPGGKPVLRSQGRRPRFLSGKASVSCRSSTAASRREAAARERRT